MKEGGFPMANLNIIIPTISTFFIVLSAICIAFGWPQIKKKNVQGHIRWMTAAAVFATLFFIFYASRTIFIGNTKFGGPESIQLYYQIFLVFHILLATTGGIMGGISLWTGYKKRYAFHKKVGPYSSVIWFGTAITGVMVYMLLYVIYPPGETDSVIKVILGF